MEKLIKLILVVCLMAYPTLLYAVDLGVVGKTFEINERDALEEVKARASRLDWKKVASKVKPSKYRPENATHLPRATRDRSFMVDMSYTLDIDVPDGKGGILYPKGYTFNPLDYVPFHKTIVVINAADRDQISWVRKSGYLGRLDVMLLLTDGAVVKVSERLGHPASYSDARVVNRFKLEAVPSVIQRVDRMMQVTEIYLPPSKGR